MLHVNTKKNASKDKDYPLEQHKVNITQLDYKSPSRWNKKIHTIAADDAPTGGDAPPDEPEQPVDRNLVCNECKGMIDVKHMQLRVKDGHRVINSPQCRWQGRATLLNYECGSKW